MTPQQFIAKWKPADLKERAACHEHFMDLCALLGEPTPATADPTGSWFTFEKGVSKDTGGQGFADVWRRNCFGWEYKGKRKDLKDAYRQLCQYRESLGNPPLMVVCDLNRFEIHTNFTGTAKEVHAFDLDGLADPKNVAKLKAAFTDPDQLKPGRTQKQVTEEVTRKFAAVADGMRGRGVEPHAAGHFLMKLMFCMFAEDIELLPKDLFLRTLRATKADPAKLSKLLADLFAAMAHKGGTFGADDIPWVNGGLFADAEVIDLAPDEIRHLEEAATYDWSAVEPSIFGTLFERILNPDKRSQLGAHYTGTADILTLLDPVLMAPLRAEWEATKADAEALYVKAKAKGVARTKEQKRRTKAGAKPAKLTDWDRFDYRVEEFLARLKDVTVLDPACGSGNFLYVALRLLLDLEKEVLTYFTARTGYQLFPSVRPGQLRGIELNPYAQELAQVVIWIGFLQWMKDNGYITPSDPVLDAMENIERRDAVLDLSDPDHPKEPDWPDAEFIVGNPPFLGSKKHRDKLGDKYVDSLLRVYKGRVQGTADLCVYWFEKARSKIADGTGKRAGLLSTQTIRGTASRNTLKRIKDSGDIFFAVSDQEWILDGAAVHVSMIGFDSGTEKVKTLDGKSVGTIHINLRSGVDVTEARKLAANDDRAFMGDTKGGAFELQDHDACRLLRQPNPHGRPNSDVLVPWANASDIAGESRDMWIIDFGLASQGTDATFYEEPYRIIEQGVKATRQKNRRESYRSSWWIHAEPRPEMRRAIEPLSRFFVTTITSKHRLFTWMQSPTIPDHKLIAFAFEDDCSFGILHSSVHRVWTHADGSQVRDRESGFTYIPTTNFLTFPFPEPTDAQREAIAAAAKQLDTLRNNWLNPPEWVRTEVLEFPGSVDGPWRRFVVDADARGIGTVKYPRVVPKDAAAEKELKKRTLTNLYNARPAWLANAHQQLDAAVLAAYGWPADLADDDLLARLLALNLSRAAGGGEPAEGDD